MRRRSQLTARCPTRALEAPVRSPPQPCTALAVSACHCVLRSVCYTNFKLTSMDSWIPRGCHPYATPSRPTRVRAVVFSHSATKSRRRSCHARFPAPATQNDARRRTRSRHSPPLPRETFTACEIPDICHAKRTLSNVRVPHTCHVKRTPSNVRVRDSPHLPPESTTQRLPKRPRASRVPRLPRDALVRHPLHTPSTIPHARHAKRHPSIQRRAHAATIPHACHPKRAYTREATRSRHAELQRPIATPKRTCREHAADSSANARRTRGKNKSNTTPALRPPFRNKNPSPRIPEELEIEFSHCVSLSVH